MHDVYISYAYSNSAAAEAVCAKLEAAHFRCWIGPRDIPPDADWASIVLGAITNARVVVLIHSKHSNRSAHVVREIEMAARLGLPLLPIKIDKSLPGPDLEYFLSSSHWLDASTPPLKNHLDMVIAQFKELLILNEGAWPWSREANAAANLTQPKSPPLEAILKDSPTKDSINPDPMFDSAITSRPRKIESHGLNHNLPYLPQPASATRTVFISAKSEDLTPARQVHDFLTSHGINAFFSDASLPQMGNSDYRKEIDRALDEAKHMVVVASKREWIEAPWVEAEWGFFINEKRSGQKTGNLVTILAGDLKPNQLPPSLRYYEAITLTDNGLNKLLAYIKS